VTTGRLDTRGSNSSIRKPLDGFDCVTNGSGIFILYGVEARRAYPEYEIIYE